jgi:uncharacterized membrane protein YfcA
MMMGINPLVAVSSQVCSAIGITFTGFLGFLRQNDVDLKLGSVALLGGFAGVFVGVKVTSWLDKIGYIKPVISAGYIVVLSSMGTLLLVQSIKSIKHKAKPKAARHAPLWAQKLPFQMTFPRTRITMTTLLPFGVGLANAILTSLLGIGNGVFMLPILTYLVGRTSPVVYGTTQMASVIMFLSTTIIMTLETTSLDLVLVLLLLIGGTIGTQIGVRISYLFHRPHLGVAGAIVVYLIALKFILGLFFDSWKIQPSSSSSVHSLDGFFHPLAIFTQEHTFLTALIGVSLAIGLSFVVEAFTRLWKKIYSVS